MDKNSTSSVGNPTSETSSRCLTDSVTTAHNFEVIRYSQLEGMGAGKFVSSSTFTVSGYGWNIRLYPDGWKEEDAGYMSTFLCYFQPVGGYWGCNKFTQKSKLQELLSRNDDCLTIRCVLTILKEPRTEEVSTGIVPVPESNLHTHFASMLKDRRGVDVTFNVGGQLFSAHRCVLAARSTVFMAELFGQMKETTMKSIKIDDMEPAIFEALLHFIYTDSLPSNCDVDQNAAWQHLLVAADRYGLDRLKAFHLQIFKLPLSEFVLGATRSDEHLNGFAHLGAQHATIRLWIPLAYHSHPTGPGNTCLMLELICHRDQALLWISNHILSRPPYILRL